MLDVGGATTDIHSVTEGSEEIAAIQITPEPMAKRTVEGDLGVFVNARVVAGQMGLEKLAKELGRDAATLFDGYKAIPDTDRQVELTERLAHYAAATALERHCGKFRYTYGSSGRVTYADGKDLTKIRYLVATGGASDPVAGPSGHYGKAAGDQREQEAPLPQGGGHHAAGGQVVLHGLPGRPQPGLP